MTEFLVLVTGFIAGLRLWLGVYDMVVAKRLDGVERAKRVLLGGGRIATALVLSTLTYAIAVPGTARNGLLVLYLIGGLTLLGTSIGELTLYDWREGDKHQYVEPTP